MVDRIRIANGATIDYDKAIDSELNVLAQNKQWTETLGFKVDLVERREELQRLVAFHLDVDAARVKLDHPHAWRQGAFNVVIPVLVYEDGAAAKDRMVNLQDYVPERDQVKRVVLRCPVPAKCAEAVYPGSILEKMRCETASYVWMQRHCPEVRIPHMYGFGFPGGKQYRHASHLHILRRVALHIRQLLASWLRQPVPSDYLPVQSVTSPVDTGYMVLEHFGASFGRELPFVAGKKTLLAEPDKMRNLFSGVSRIILALARVPQPRIGAFRFNYDGTISLENRPITCDMLCLENEGAPRTMAVDATYTNIDQYVSDLETFHDQQFLSAPNATWRQADCENQISARSFLRTVTPYFINNGRRNGPFVLSMSDQNAANIMVDEDWNVTGIYDLEWIISAPVDTIQAPGWLAWDAIDTNAGSGYSKFNEVRTAFMQAFRAEECLANNETLKEALGGTLLSSIMEENWATDRVWFYSALLSFNAIYLLVRSRLRSVFHIDRLSGMELFRLWNPNTKDIVTKKLHDRTAYVADVTALFGREPQSTEATGCADATKEESEVLSIPESDRKTST